MNLSVLLLCYLAVFQSAFSSKTRSPSDKKFSVFIQLGFELRYRDFEPIESRWLAPPEEAHVQLEASPPSFASYMQMRSLELHDYIERSSSVTKESFREILHASDKAITDVRDAFWRFLFLMDSTGTCSPALDRIDEICERYDIFLRTTSFGRLLQDCTIGPVLELYVTDFVFPLVTYHVKSTSYVRCIQGSKISPGYIQWFIEDLGIVKFAASNHIPFENLFRIGPDLLLCCNIVFIDREHGSFFRSALRSEYSPSEADDILEDIVSEYRPDLYSIYPGTPEACFYLEATIPDGSKGWVKTAPIEGPLRISSRGILQWSIEQVKVEAQHARSKIRAGKAVEYHPRGTVSEELPLVPTMPILPPEIWARIFTLCLQLDPTTRVSGICTWTRRESSNFIPDSEECILKLFRAIRVPSNKLLDFILASIITIADRHELGGPRKVEIERLCLFVRRDFPLRRSDLLEKLEGCSGGKSSLPGHLSKYPLDHSRSEALKAMVEALAPHE